MREEFDEQEEDVPKPAEDSYLICSHCMGSGEGQYEGTKCYYCNGTGQVPTE